MKRLFILTELAILSFANALAQGHWGIQGDVARVDVPTSVIEKINALPERPEISGTAFSVGLVRFNGEGAPSYALQFSKLRASLEETQPSGQRHITGTASIRGFMATKYVNFVTRKYVSGGLALGGGIGKLDAAYARSEIFQGVPRLIDSGTYNGPFPLFEILGRVDVRPVKYITVGPYYGIRNGTLALGAALRLHITK